MIKEDTVKQILDLSGGDTEILIELFSSFIEDAKELGEEISKAFEANDASSLKTHIHTLKGLCGTIGATTVFEKSYAIDLILKEKGSFSDSEQMMDLLQENEDLILFVNEKYLK